MKRDKGVVEFNKIKKDAKRMCELRQAVIDAAIAWHLERSVNSFEMAYLSFEKATKALIKFEKKIL